MQKSLTIADLSLKVTASQQYHVEEKKTVDGDIMVYDKHYRVAVILFYAQSTVTW